MAIARISRGRKYGLGRRVALKVMVLGVVGLMSLAGTNPAMAATNQDNGSFWTQFTPSTDTRLIFVSSSEGDDSNNGLTPATPVKTLTRAEALLRNGFPDWMLLKRGDTWDHMLPFWSKSGRSETEMMVVGAYGEGGQRPKVMPEATASGAIRAQGNGEVSHVAFVGLHLEPSHRADNQNITGVVWLRRSRNILFEDLFVSGFSNNFSIQSISEAAPISDVRLNGCVAVGAWNRSGHSQGIYAEKIDGLTIENCIFFANGFNAERGANPTVFNHNIYLSSDNSRVIVRSNIIADASSHGLQARSGGEVVDNLFLSNPISILFGSNLPTTNPAPGGVAGVVSRNVIMYGRSIDPGTPRAWGIDITNVNFARVTNNILFSSVIGYNGDSIQVGDNRAFGISDTIIENNSIVDWNGPVSVNAPGDTQSFADVVVRNNRIWRDLGANAGNSNFNKPFFLAFSSSHPGLRIENNFYYYKNMHNRPFVVSTQPLTIEAWRMGPEPSSTFQTISSMPLIGVESYMSSIGMSGNWREFVQQASRRSRIDFDTRFTPQSVRAWVEVQLDGVP